MRAENIGAGRRLSSHERIFCMVFMAMLQLLLIWDVARTLPRLGWESKGMDAFLTLALIAMAYDLVIKGKLTQRTVWVGFAVLVATLAADVFDLRHHTLSGDPYWTIPFDAAWIVAYLVWIRRKPLEAKGLNSSKSNVSILRD
jgi:hypothetical protein